MTNPPQGYRRTTVTRAAFLAAPLCMLAYGIIRLSDPDHGPGPAWTAGHIALLPACRCSPWSSRPCAG
ncbi:hypothetical protein [Streptomyces sp. 147326]|uniref:hypothetical protein n=1 Tax=Streptomyces sp. 147326 TaxID=3074379 RepID=UPI00385794D1